MVTGNEPIATTDNTSGLKRRRITVPFTRKFLGSAKEQVQLISNKYTKDGSISFGAFSPELPGLINWLLEMSEDDMRSYLIETNKHSTMLKTFNEAVDITTNLQQAWLTECVVFNPVGQHRFGKRIDNKNEQNSTHPFADWEKDLYPSYLDFAHGVSSGKPSAMGLMRFKAWLLDELQNVLRLNVSMVKKGNCYELRGISLRASHAARKPGIYAHPNFEGYPTVNEAAEDPQKWEEQLREWIPESIIKDIQILKD